MLLFDSNWQFPTVAQAAERLQLSVEVFSCDYKLHALVIMPSYARAHQVTQHACRAALSSSLSPSLSTLSLSHFWLQWACLGSRSLHQYKRSPVAVTKCNFSFQLAVETRAGRAVAANQLTKLADWLFVCCIAAVVALRYPVELHSWQ